MIGSMCDGSIIRWSPELNNSCEKIQLNKKNEYSTVDFSKTDGGRNFAIAGLLP